MKVGRRPTADVPSRVVALVVVVAEVSGEIALQAAAADLQVARE
jgi:hypothetical protein